jgi:hypothetical protein
MHLLRIFVLAILILTGFQTMGQGNVQTFGQNRVQYKEFLWSFYESKRFATYFYLGGQDIGKFAIQAADKELRDIEKKLEYKVSKRIDILVYNDLSDFWQSNIGVGIEMNNIGGLTRIVGNKMFIYFNGNHRDLREQIRQGLATIMVNDMMYGGNLQEVLQNAVLLNLPSWFTDGLISYLAEGWNPELDNRLKDGILSKRYLKFNKLEGADARYAGHFIWHYIGQKYGHNAIPNLLYLTRINRSLESGFLFVLGKTVNQTIGDWYDYNEERFTKELDRRKRQMPIDSLIVQRKIKKGRTYYNVRVSPDAKKVAFVSNEIGKQKVRILDLETGKSKVVFRNGFRTVTLPVDYSKPLIEWNPDGRRLGIVYVKRDKIQFAHYDLETEKRTTKEMTKFQEVSHFSYMDSTNIVLSAVNKGHSDIYTYNLPATTLTQITNDFYDDLQPAYVDVKSWRTPLNERDRKRGIVFISNRESDRLRTTRFDTTLPTNHFDVYFYDLESRSKKLIQVTNTPYVSEQLPLHYNRDHVAYLSASNGISNRHHAYFDIEFSHYDTLVHFYRVGMLDPVIELDSMFTDATFTLDSIERDPLLKVEKVTYIKRWKDVAISSPQTNLEFGILEHHLARGAGKGLDVMLHQGTVNFYWHDIKRNLRDQTPLKLDNSTYWKSYLKEMRLKEKKAARQKAQNKKKQAEQESEKIDVTEYRFKSEIEKESIFKTAKPDSVKPKHFLELTQIKPYRVRFSSDFVVSQLDNSLIFTGYAPFNGNGGVFSNPDLSAMIDVSISDLFEDYRFVGGFRLPTNFKGSEYFVTYEDMKYQLDRQFLYYRKNDFSLFENPFGQQPISAKLKTNYYEGSLKWPLDILRSFRGALGFRNDRLIFLSTDNFSHSLPTEDENWGSVKFEYVFDNTIPIAMNILNGTRYKVYYEFYKQLNEKDVSFSVVGFDARHYQRIHRQIISATRLVGATSFGNRRVVFFMGGVDSWLFADFNNDFPVDPSANYAFQALATNMRGFNQNIRHGNSYAALNQEIRFPIFAYLFNSPIKSSFLKNFQVVGFGDVGTSWEGASPYIKDNPLNTKVISHPNNPVWLKVNYFRNPLVAGYGAGIRSILFGYFIRIDHAWGIEDGIRQDPIWYISLGMDF